MDTTTHPQDSRIPERPLTVIEPSRGWRPVDVVELWTYRELLFALAGRDLKVRYKQTALGILWVLLQPIAMTVVFSLFFGRFAGISADGLIYPVFVFAGLLPWTFFSNAVINSSNSLVGNSALITKVYFPRIIIPVAAILSSLVDLLISFVILFLLMLFYGVAFSVNLLILPVLAVLTAVFAASVGIWLSALNVRYRDVRHALPFVLQIWLFATPIIYPSSIVPDSWKPFLLINPMAAIVEAYRSAIFARPFDQAALTIAVVIVSAMLIFALFAFRRMERRFADII